MKLVDANLLLYAVNRDAPLHREAKEWMEEALNGQEAVAFSWVAILAFLRLTTRAGFFESPITVQAAFDLVAEWLDQPAATIVHPGPRHFAIMRELLLPLGTAGNLTSDAHLAALAIEHGAELCSCDSDFGRFPRVKWRNPLAS